MGAEERCRRRRYIAATKNIRPSIAGLSKSLVGGEYCHRGRGFAEYAIPSLVAMHHRDLDASILYEFCVKNLNLRGRRMADEGRECEQRSREKRNEDENALRSQSRRR